mmetsp:Transcript_13995/g.19591  ORF Transcript_13995/g.19591 Transcript_13995/m.19591 type:complete len:120 (-) Transcript_13995:55-414(-)
MCSRAVSVLLWTIEDKPIRLDDRDIVGSAVGGGRNDSKDGSLCVTLIFKCRGGGEIGKVVVSLHAGLEVSSLSLNDSWRDSFGFGHDGGGGGASSNDNNNEGSSIRKVDAGLGDIVSDV